MKDVMYAVLDKTNSSETNEERRDRVLKEAHDKKMRDLDKARSEEEKRIGARNYLDATMSKRRRDRRLAAKAFRKQQKKNRK